MSTNNLHFRWKTPKQQLKNQHRVLNFKKLTLLFGETSMHVPKKYLLAWKDVHTRK